MFTPIGFFAPQGGEIVTTGLEQWFDVTEGTEALSLTDKSGNARNGTREGDAAKMLYNTTYDYWDVAQTGKDSYIDTNYQGPKSTYSFESWFSATTLGNQDECGLVAIRDSSYGTNFFETVIYKNTGNIVFAESDSSGNEVVLFADDANYKDGNFHLVTVTRASGGSTKIYVDGVEKDSATTNAGVITRAVDTFVMGNYLTINKFMANGRQGSYRYYSIALSAAQVLQNFDAEKSHYGL